MFKLFRSDFAYDQTICWYPQHQSRALQLLKDGIHHIDLVIEVRDARIPLTSINTKFDQILANRERIVVYNKSDLANNNFKKPLQNALWKHRQETCIFTKANQGVNVKLILDKAIEKCRSNPARYRIII
jgi:ribosome biogenesis GTPase A